MARASPGRDAAMLGSASVSVWPQGDAPREQDGGAALADDARTAAFPHRLLSSGLSLLFLQGSDFQPRKWEA